jgi:predicted double-glycine peptidase
VLNEFVNLVEGQKNDSYIVLTAMVDDPVYLTGPFVRTYNFKKESDGKGWDPTPCWNK